MFFGKLEKRLERIETVIERIEPMVEEYHAKRIVKEKILKSAKYYTAILGLITLIIGISSKVF